MRQMIHSEFYIHRESIDIIIKNDLPISIQKLQKSKSVPVEEDTVTNDNEEKLDIIEMKYEYDQNEHKQQQQQISYLPTMLSIIKSQTSVNFKDDQDLTHTKTGTSDGLNTILQFGIPWQETVATFKNPKQEILENKYKPLAIREWNDLLRKCVGLSKTTKAKVSKLTLKQLVALKLYTDFDDLQREFRKCFRAPYNQDTNRLSSFYWWNKTLIKAFRTFNQIKEQKKYNLLFHGISSVMCIDKFKGKYFGPLSTTTDINVARSFAGKAGMILVIAPVYNEENGYKPFDISYLSEFSDEHEVLCFNQSYFIKNVILSHEFDENFLIYDSIYSTPVSGNTSIIGEPDHEIDSDDEYEHDYEEDIDTVCDQNERIKCLYKLSELIMNNDGDIEIECAKFLLEFISEYINNEIQPTKFDVFIDSNIKYLIKRCHECNISMKLLNEIANTESCDVCANQIKDLFSQYFNSNNVKFV
eukprot:265955_1